MRYSGYLTAGVERWKEYRDQLKPLKQKPVLFIMMNSTEDADDVADWLRRHIRPSSAATRPRLSTPTESGEVSKKDLDKARKAVRDVDAPTARSTRSSAC